MTIHRPTIKAQARQAMRLARPRPIPMTLLYLLLTSGISILIELFFQNPIILLAKFVSEGLDLSRSAWLTLSQIGSVGLFFHILILILTAALSFGYSLWCLGTTRGGIGEWRDLFTGCTMLGRILLLRLAVVTLSLIWYAVLMMLAMLLSRVAMFFSPLGILSALPIFAATLWFFFWRVLHYSLADFCLMDAPDSGVFRAIGESRRLMRGHCGQFVLLHISFWGWLLLSILIQVAAEFVLFIPGLPTLLAVALSALFCWPFTAWLAPYQTMTICRFYDSLREGSQPQV